MRFRSKIKTWFTTAGMLTSLALAMAIIFAIRPATAAPLGDTAGPPSGDGVVPTLVASNPSCITLNADNARFPSITSNFGFKLNGQPVNGIYTFTDHLEHWKAEPYLIQVTQ